jgi:hypothetical protein
MNITTMMTRLPLEFRFILITNTLRRRTPEC